MGNETVWLNTTLRGTAGKASENTRPGKCRTWKITDQIAGLKNAGLKLLPLVEYVLIH